jgi:hypothetical protein
MAWKMTKDLSHPMWGGNHFTIPKPHKWPTIKELAQPPKPPAPPGYTYIWRDANSKISSNSKQTPRPLQKNSLT